MSDNTICFCSLIGQDAHIDKNQTYRFMGCKKSENDELDLIYRECVDLVKAEALLKAVWRKSSLHFLGEDTVGFDFGTITSAALCKNLEGCKEAYVFAATTGMGIDRMLLKYQRLDPVKAMVLSAVGSSCIECWCDKINAEIAKGKKTKPRFSPGYGGVDLRHQREVLNYLEAEKRLGITLTDSFFMTPVKSVTAFIGVVEE